MTLQQAIKNANEEQLRLAVSALLLGMQEQGFGSDEAIDGADCVDAMNALYEDVSVRILGAAELAPN